MSDKIKEMIDEIEALKLKLGEEIAQHEKDISYEIQNGYVRFEEEVLNKQKENMKNLLAWFRDIPLLHLLVSPLVYGMLIPAILFDIILFIYQQVVFRIFKF
ncbi:MAG: hypothetical protein J7J02_06270, partial [Sulfurovum sp.]|nr:hypothetical protein [Sulfurovum sp.]